MWWQRDPQGSLSSTYQSRAPQGEVAGLCPPTRGPPNRSAGRGGAGREPAEMSVS